jgi:hypothetical protein
MNEANRQFMQVEAEYREMIAMNKISDAPTSMRAVRQQLDPVYRAIRGNVNGLLLIPEEAETNKELVAEMNVLIARYDAMLAARKRTTTGHAPLAIADETKSECECK